MTRWPVGAVLAVVVASACSDSPVAPTDVAGSYHINSFKVVINGVTTDLASAGASINLTLSEDGKTTGHITVPAAGGANPSPVDEDLAGTYHLGGGVLQIDQNGSGGYLDGMLFTADPPELRGYITLNDGVRTGQLTLILSRQ